MQDALLYSVRDAIIGAGYNYDKRSCEVMPDEQPKPNCGDVFVSVHQGASRSDMKNALNEYFGFILTLTLRLSKVPIDRVGDQLLAVKLAKATGFNRRCEQLRALLHQDWGVLQDANSYLVQMEPDAEIVYGFCEAAQYMGMDNPSLVGPEWFMAEAGSQDVGLKANLRFDGARRLQPIASYV